MNQEKYFKIFLFTRFSVLVFLFILVLNYHCASCEWFPITYFLLLGFALMLPIELILTEIIRRFSRRAATIIFSLLSVLWGVATLTGAVDFALSDQEAIKDCHYQAEKLVAECTYPAIFNISCRQLDEREGKSAKFKHSVETGCSKALSQKNSACIYNEQGKVTAFNMSALDSSPLLRGFKARCSPTLFDPLLKLIFGETRAEALIPSENPAKTREELRERLMKYSDPSIGVWK